MRSEAAELLAKRIPEVLAFRTTLDPETDRGCALMASAYLDSQIEKLLDRCFIEDDVTVKEMLGQSKPLGTFSARIDMSYLLGRISEQARRDLHLIRKIRNDFGHDPKPLDFTSSKIADRCRELYHTPLDHNEPPRKRFTNAVLGVLAAIHAASHHAKRPPAATNLDLSPDVKKKMRKRSKAIARRLMKEFSDKKNV